jgi:ABC-type uncharacterized transport system involved in gliding motility auxiliary subunit
MTTHTTTVAKRTYGAGALLGLAVLFIGVTILITFLFRGARLDLTESKLYSLSEGTTRIVRSLEEPVNLYFFFSEEASAQQQQLRAYAQRVRELLEEITARSNGKLRLHVIDPQPFSEEEDRAAEFGLSAVPTGTRGQTLYFGLAGTNSVDGREVIGFFQPSREEFLEYDIASLIYRLGNPKRPTVGLMSMLRVDSFFDQMSGRLQEGWASIAQLRQLFDVRTVPTTTNAIDADIDVLVVIHPKDLSTATLYAIDQFVMRGGKLIAFVDPVAENDTAGGPMGIAMGPRASSLAPLLDAYGVRFDSTMVLGDRELGLPVSLHAGQPPSQHIAVIGLNRASMNSQDVITATLDNINVMTAGVLKKKDGAEIEFEPLLQSSAHAGLIPASRLAFLQDASALLEGFQETGERYTVAARVRGKLKSAYPDGKPEGVSGETGEHRAESVDTANLIVVADTDILADMMWIRWESLFGQRFAVGWANNGDFLANALDNLTGSSDLISIRGRQSFFRPFTKVDELRRQADDRLRAKEQELDNELRETERRLTELEAGRNEQGSLVLSPEQEAELERFQRERLRIRKELREVRRSLDVEIERLGTWLKVLNIIFVPALIAVAAIVLAAARQRRLRAGRAAAHAG